MGFFDDVEKRRAKNKAYLAKLAQARGRELGHVSITYMGGFNNKKRSNGKLFVYENLVIFSQIGVPHLVINASDITGIEVGGQQQTNSRISITRMATLGVFSLAAPKRTKIKDTTVILSLKDGQQVFFHTKMFTEFEVHGKLANAISYYHRLQLAKASQQQAVSQAPPTDNAREIMKYAILRKRGVITEEEFQTKKKQLLGL